MLRNATLALFSTPLVLGACATPEPATPKSNKANAASVEAGLTWLAKHQSADGRWDADGFMINDTAGEACDGAGNPSHDIGATGLALLAFMGAGNTMRSGPHKEVIKSGVKWLRTQQGNNGLFGTAAAHDFIYDHAIATYAMVEAYGLAKYRTLRKNAQGGLNYLEAHRNPYACWRYQPRDNENDASVTAWCVFAYAAARDFELEVNPNALKIAKAYYAELTNPKTGRVGYTKRGEMSSRHPGDHATRFPPQKGETITAAALLARLFLRQSSKEPALRRGADLVAKKPPKWTAEGDVNHAYWYFGTYAMYQFGGHYWSDWQSHLQAAVLATQRKDGNFRGSWDPVGVWGEDGGRIYSTALMVLTTEVRYRYTRLVR